MVLAHLQRLGETEVAKSGSRSRREALLQNGSSKRLKKKR